MNTKNIFSKAGLLIIYAISAMFFSFMIMDFTSKKVEEPKQTAYDSISNRLDALQIEADILEKEFQEHKSNINN